jgi:uncharacterized protein (UPF0248 family)
MVYRVLGRLLWNEEINDAEIIIIHRGGLKNKKIICGRDVTSIKKSYLVYRDSRGEETTIPLHRVLEVRLKGKPLWKRKEKP